MSEGTQFLGKAPDTTRPRRDHPPGSRVNWIAAEVRGRKLAPPDRAHVWLFRVVPYGRIALQEYRYPII